MATEPITGLTYQEAGSLQTDALQNAELNYYGAWLNCVVLTVGDTAPPGSPADGDRYIVGTSATGAWSTHDDKLAVYRDGWQFYEPIEGVAVHNLDDASDWIFEGSAGWAVKSSGGASTWGTITGTLSAQTDLQSALDAKLALAGGSLTGALNESKGTDIASAGTTNISSATGNFVHITGTTTITAFGTAQAGTRRVLVFDGALLLTHNATSLILPTGAGITTAAGDTATMVSEGSGNWRCTNYQRKDGTALAASGGLTNFTDGLNSSSPNATIPVASFTATNAATNVDAAFIAKGTGAIVAQIPDNTTAGGNKRGARATDFQRSRSNANQVASGADSFVAGINNRADAVGAVAFGSSNISSGEYSFTTGTGCDARQIDNIRVLGSAVGRQAPELVLYANTTNATPTVLRSNASAASATNQYAMNNGCAGMVRVRVIARQTAGSGTGDCASWDTSVLVKDISGTVSIVGTPPVAQAYGDAGAAAWAIALTADATNDALAITVTGEASKTIQWTAHVLGPEA